MRTIENGWITRELRLGHESAVSRGLRAASSKAEASLLKATAERVFARSTS